MKGYKWHTRKLEHKCQQCGKVFVEYGTPKFCGRDCFWKAKVFVHNKPHTEKSKQKCRDATLKRYLRGDKGFFEKGNDNWRNPNVIKTQFTKGQRPSNWNGGIRTEYQKMKDDVRYKKWRRQVYQRDNFICQGCGEDDVSKIRPHHLKQMTKYPELAYEVDNGITSCIKCHPIMERESRLN